LGSNRRRLKLALGGVIAALALTATASPAMAEFQPAKFDKAGLNLVTSGVTIELSGGSAKTCTTGAVISGAVHESTWATLGNFVPGITRLGCSGGTTLEMRQTVYGERDSTTGATRLYDSENGAALISPYGEYLEYETFAPYTNGSGATPSVVTFNKTPIGLTASFKTITMTGTFQVTYNKEAVKIVP
jgi:hypothetical protein